MLLLKTTNDKSPSSEQKIQVKIKHINEINVKIQSLI